MINPERFPITTAWRIVILLSILIWVGIISGIAHSADVPVAPKPPTMSFGVSQCGKMIALWIITQDGHMVRMDKDHHPDTVEHQKALLEWVNTGPVDIYVMSCGITA